MTAMGYAFFRHCEERSDEAIQFLLVALDCFAALAMTFQRHRPATMFRF